ncbi:hypothetical protein D3C73_1637060 [compost metagenome]
MKLPVQFPHHLVKAVVEAVELMWACADFGSGGIVAFGHLVHVVVQTENGLDE